MVVIFGFIFGLVFGIMIISGIHSLVNYIVGKCFGEQVYSFMYLCFTKRTINNEKRLTFGTFSPTCQLTMIKKGQSEREDKIIVIITTILNLSLSILYWPLFLWLFPYKIQTNFLFGILIGLGVWYIVSELMATFLAIHLFKNIDKHLLSRTRYIANQLIQGVYLNDIDIPDYRELGLKYFKSELNNYQNFAFMKRIWLDDLSDIHDIVKSIEKNIDLNSYGYVLSETHTYYNLVFYYSCIAPNEYKAHRIFDVINKELVTDTDANGRRVLAYYTYYVEKDSARAKLYLEEASSHLNKIMFDGERAYEEKLIMRLKETIEEYNAV